MVRILQTHRILQNGASTQKIIDTFTTLKGQAEIVNKEKRYIQVLIAK